MYERDLLRESFDQSLNNEDSSRENPSISKSRKETKVRIEIV